MNETRITYLWRRFSTQKASRAELDELMDLLAAGRHDEESMRYLETQLQATPPEQVDYERWTPMLTGILAQPEKPVSRLRRILQVSAVAAAMAGLLWGANYVWHTYKHTRQPAAVVKAPPADVAPGGNRAVLVLASGQRMLLDTAATGNLALQGNMQVQKLKEGQLAYKPASKRSDAAEDGRITKMNLLTTPRGGQYGIWLPDGTHVWLNAASSLRFPTAFTGAQREVELTGEAYFEVKHDAAHPFRVKVGGQLIEDIGTAFNVNAYPEETAAKTTLVEGAVKVSASGANTVVLKPAQQAQVQAGQDIHVISGVNTDQVIAWKNGQISFDNADLQTLLRQVSRWYDVDVVYTGAIPQKRFFGLLDRSVYLSTIIEYFQENGIHIKQAGKTIVVSP